MHLLVKRRFALAIIIVSIVIITNNINALNTPGVTISNVLASSGQYETINTVLSGGTSPYTVNFFNVTGSKTAQVYGYQQWLSTNSYPIIISDAACATNSNIIYCIAGYQSGYTNLDYYAPIFNSGVIGTWTTTNSYPLSLADPSCFINSNNIYCVAGGSNSNYNQVLC